MDFLQHFFGSAGTVTQVHTVVDYYTYIKGLEYLICVGFFVGFPIFYRYINSEKPAQKSLTPEAHRGRKG